MDQRLEAPSARSGPPGRHKGIRRVNAEGSGIVNVTAMTACDCAGGCGATIRGSSIYCPGCRTQATELGEYFREESYL